MENGNDLDNLQIFFDFFLYLQNFSEQSNNIDIDMQIQLSEMATTTADEMSLENVDMVKV